MTAVSIVVTLVDGEPLATTAGSVVAASWHPPLLAVLFRSGSRMDAALGRSGRFTVNVLGEADHALAHRFARGERRRGWAALTDLGLRRRDPAPPALSCAAAWADCRVVQSIPVGDHRLYLGEVRDMDRDDTAAPLAYYRGRFRGLGATVAPPAWAPTDAVDLTAAW